MSRGDAVHSVVCFLRHLLDSPSRLKVCKVFKGKDLGPYLDLLLSTEARLDSRAFMGLFLSLRITGAPRVLGQKGLGAGIAIGLMVIGRVMALDVGRCV